MCFSATVSFSTAAVLAGMGVYAIRHAGCLPLAFRLWAVVPALFAVQQAFEGGVWLALEAGNADAALACALGFHLFSHFLWPWWFPLSSFLSEPGQAGLSGKLRKLIFGACAAIGAFAGTLVYAAMLMHPEWMTLNVRGHSIVYDFSVPYRSDIHLPVTPVMLYGFIILAPLLFSSHPLIRIFGVLVMVSMALASMAYNAAFVSVWCFFAAVLSLYLVYMTHRLGEMPRAVRGIQA